MVIFAAILEGSGFATNYLVSSVIDYHPMLRQLVPPGCGLVAGYFRGVPGVPARHCHGT